MERGDWVVPTFNSELRPQKPILIYWLMMFAYQVIGPNEWGARFFSAVFGTGTVLLTYQIGKRMFCPSVGFWAGLVLATNIMFTVASRAATPDAILIFFSTLTIFLYVQLFFQPFHPDRLRTIEESTDSLFPTLKKSLPIFIAMAFGTLAKGPVAVVLPCMIIGLFQLILKSRTNFETTEIQDGGVRTPKGIGDWFSIGIGVLHPGRFLTTLWQMHPLAIVAVVLLIAGPWYFLVGLQTDWQFLKIFFLRENFQRAASAMESHSGGIWYHPVMIQVFFFPWSLLTIPVGLAFWKILREPERYGIWYPGITLALVWIGLQIGVFSIVKTKLPSYVTPCYPALALLWGIYLHRITRGEKFHPLWLLGGVYLLKAAVGVTILYGIGYLLVTPPTTPLEGWLIGIPLLLSAIVGFWLGLKKGGRWFSAVMGVGSFSFIVVLFGFGTVLIDGYRQTEKLWEHLPDRSNEQAALASFNGSFASTWVYYARRPIYEIHITDANKELDLVTAPEKVKGLFDDRKFWERRIRPSIKQFLTRFPEGQILVASHDWETLRKYLPEHYKVIDRCPYFLKEKYQKKPKELYLVGPQSD